MQIRPPKKLIVIGLLLGLGTILVLAAPPWLPAFLLAKVFFQCREELTQEMRSEDGRYIAKVFERNCGATTRLITRLDLRSSGPWLIAKDQEVFVQENQCPIDLTWRRDTLHVAYRDPCGEVFRQMESWEGIQIRFKTNPPA